MFKLTLVALLTIYTSIGYGTSDFFVWKKNNKTIARFFKGSYIAFQVNKQQWQTGYITILPNDSFWIRPMVVYFGLMNIDTVHLNVISFALSDVYAMLKKGIQVDYIKGRFQITKTGGHVHWNWWKVDGYLEWAVLATQVWAWWTDFWMMTFLFQKEKMKSALLQGYSYSVFF